MSNNYIQNVSGGTGVYASVSPGYSSYHPDNTKPQDGFVRNSNGKFEYYNATNNFWMPMDGDNLYISIDPDIIGVMEWAKEKMAEEVRIKELAGKYPALKKAKENYDMVKALVENDN
jgi:hypothetical protein